ncbi:MAG: hypothetical protein Kapaf2KO_07370 [Candidatus Kapaibacteriales bacterium]
MKSVFPNLTNPPIVESIIGFRVSKILTDSQKSIVSEKLSKDFQKISNFPNISSPSESRMIFSSDMEKDITITLYSDGIDLNYTKKYKEFDKLKRYFDKYIKELLNDIHPTLIVLRYINSFEGKNIDYIQNTIDRLKLFESSITTIHSFGIEHEYFSNFIKDNNKYSSANTLLIDRIQTDPFIEKVIFDIETRVQVFSNNINLDDILKNLRRIKNHIFFSLYENE